jgi:uncharacterized protein (DUF433 family)
LHDRSTIRTGLIHSVSTARRGRKGRTLTPATTIQAFPQRLVSSITGLSKRQLEYWDTIGVVSPSIARYVPWLPRLYSFQDVLKLKVAAKMRDHKMLPGQIKRKMAELEERGFDDPLLTLRFVADPNGREVFYLHPNAGPMSVRAPDQTAEVFDVKLEDLRTGLEDTIQELMKRPTGKVAKIRQLQGSAPVIEGTRVPTSRIAMLHAEGWDTDRIVQAIPHLTPEDVEAALAFEKERAARRTA